MLAIDPEQDLVVLEFSAEFFSFFRCAKCLEHQIIGRLVFWDFEWFSSEKVRFAV
jgi:hypothetical protein